LKLKEEKLMNQVLCHPKIKPEHLARRAIVYLRQSSEKQVRQNKESQRLQYDVAERMRSLGWKAVEIIANDLGSSASMASARREGFERVLSSVALGEVGIVGSWEVSRLSRTDKDWCRLLEVCQIFGTLIADEQHIYDLSSLDETTTTADSIASVSGAPPWIAGWAKNCSRSFRISA
jgi:DNA invertase Pin-like site-specific DNA recombinase